MNGSSMVQQLGPWTIEATQEYVEIDLRGTTERDPDWKFVDGAGHGHFWSGKDLPTLRWVARPCTLGHDDDCTSEGFYVCIHCTEEIRPAHRTPSVISRREPGQLRVSLTGSWPKYTKVWHLSGQQARDVLTDPVKAIPLIESEREPDFTEFRP